MRNALLPVFLCAVMALGACATPASAARGEIAGLNDRLAKVERLIAGLQSTADAASDPTSLTVRISQMEREIQSLTGTVEELSYELDQANRRLEAVSQTLIGGLDSSSDFSDPGRAVASAGPVALSAGDPIADQLNVAAAEERAVSVELPFDPDAAFDYASGFLLQGDYERAQEAFELYVEAFPNHSHTANAQFRLGEIYLATGANAKAADAFIAHIRAYPNDPRAAEAYLKLGTAFARLEQPEQACKVFKSMKAKYPNASQPVVQRADLEMARINCQ